MFIQVKLLHGYTQMLTYAIPPHWSQTPVVGDIVSVPLRQQTVLAEVRQCLITLPADATFKVRPASNWEALFNSAEYKIFSQNLSRYYQIPPAHFMQRSQSFITAPSNNKAAELNQLPTDLLPTPLTINPTNTDAINSVTTLSTHRFTAAQQAAYATIAADLLTPRYQPHVLYGVTGAGKTEIYLQLIQQAFQLHKTTVLLLPEVALAHNFAQLLRARLPATIPIYSFYTGTTPKQKQSLWAHLNARRAGLIIGVHQPILLPIPNLGLVIIDEEHDPGYQEKQHPQLNTKEVALMRAQTANIPIVLGSATPALSTLYNIEKQHWQLSRLTHRFQGSFPQIQVVNLRTSHQRRPRANFWFSTELVQALQQRLQNGEQALVFINRRGYSFFIQCAQCGDIPHCRNCAVSLTLHSDQSLRCHYCDTQTKYPDQCPVCQTVPADFIKKGLGTQQVVALLQKLLPQARIARADLDVTRSKKRWAETVTAFQNHQLDILVGTQTITKGYHFPRVTLVGILWADLNLHFPIYNAAETCLQQLIQVAGRAGRQSPASTVIVQTLTEHPIFNYLTETSYPEFYTQELAQRQELQYPPVWRLAEIELKHQTEAQVRQDALLIAQRLQQFAAQLTGPAQLKILGPTKPPVAKIKNWHFRKIYLKSASFTTIAAAWQSLGERTIASRIFFTPNPQQ